MISSSGSCATDDRSATQPLTGQCSDASSPSFQGELLLIRTSPEIWRLALRRAGCRDLAEDALQGAVARRILGAVGVELDTIY